MSVPILQWQRKDFCHYTFHHGRRVCPHDDQDRLLQHYLDRAHGGSKWAANMLQLTPCDLWPFIQGRTVWLMGDSITQVRREVTALRQGSPGFHMQRTGSMLQGPLAALSILIGAGLVKGRTALLGASSALPCGCSGHSSR